MSSSPTYVIYYRVSTKKQGESGLGLDAQRAYVNHFYNGKPVLAEFTDVRSGKTISKRPELQKALALCQQQGATLVVAKIDRLSRNTEQALQIYRELDGRLESCDIPNLDKFTLTLFMAIADRERELIGLRTKQALDQKCKQVGEWRKGGGTKRRPQPASSVLRSPVTNENEHKRRAKVLATTLRAAGKHYQAIADQLNAADFKTIAMYFSDQLAAIGRIAVAIKAFRQHTGYTGRLVESPALNTYLADRLLPTDFNLWTSLSLTERIN